MAKKEIGIFGVICILVVFLIIGIMLVEQNPDDNSEGARITRGLGNIFIWGVILIFVFIAVIGVIILLKKFDVFDEIFNSGGL